jgi:hypothetical protein
MNFIEITTKGGNQALINVQEISDIINTTEGKCVIYLKNPDAYYGTEESYEEIKMKLHYILQGNNI